MGQGPTWHGKGEREHYSLLSTTPGQRTTGTITKAGLKSQPSGTPPNVALLVRGTPSYNQLKREMNRGKAPRCTCNAVLRQGPPAGGCWLGSWLLLPGDQLGTPLVATTLASASCQAQPTARPLLSQPGTSPSRSHFSCQPVLVGGGDVQPFCSPEQRGGCQPGVSPMPAPPTQPGQGARAPAPVSACRSCPCPFRGRVTASRGGLLLQ